MKIRKNILNKIFIFFSIFATLLILIIISNITPGLKGSIDQELRILFKQSDKILNRSIKVSSINLYNSIKFWNSNEKIYDTLQIDISYKNLKILRDERKKALKLKYNLSRKKIPIQINFKNKRYKATARLKGGLSDHYGNNKQFSLMIKLKKNKSINGMSEFALTQHLPRQFPNNLLYSELLTSLGLSMPKFVTYKIRLNGDDWGLMLAEEQYSNKYYELRNKNYSPTVKFTNEDNSDLRRILNAKFNSGIDEKILKFLEYRHGKIENKIFNKNDFNNQKFSSILSYLKDIKYDLIKNKISNSELDLIFDMDKLSKVIILAFLTGDYHALGYRNIRFYYNEYTKKLEPIPTDWGFTLRSLKNEEQLDKEMHDVINCVKGCTYHGHVIYDKIMKNKIFQENFVNNLNIFLDEIKRNKKTLKSLCKFQNNCLSRLNFNILENNLIFLKKNINYIKIFNKNYSNNSKAFLKQNIKINESVRNEYFEILNNAVYSRVFSDGKLKLINLTPYPIEIYLIKLQKKNCLSNKKNKKKYQKECITTIDQNILLTVTDFEFFEYDLKTSLQNYDSVIIYSKYQDFKFKSSEFDIEDQSYLRSVKLKEAYDYKKIDS